MYLAKQLELTEKEIEYAHMLRTAWHLHGHEMDLHREAMNQLADEIQKVRQDIAFILARQKLNPYR